MGSLPQPPETGEAMAGSTPSATRSALGVAVPLGLHPPNCIRWDPSVSVRSPAADSPAAYPCRVSVAGAGGKSELKMSRTTFQPPSACFFQISIYFPLSCTGDEPSGAIVIS